MLQLTDGRYHNIRQSRTDKEYVLPYLTILCLRELVCRYADSCNAGWCRGNAHFYWCVAHRMVLTAASIVYRRMLGQRDGEYDGGSGRGLIKLDLLLLVTLQIATIIRTPLELNFISNF